MPFPPSPRQLLNVCVASVEDGVIRLKRMAARVEESVFISTS